MDEVHGRKMAIYHLPVSDARAWRPQSPRRPGETVIAWL